jgi:hypothetical protein
MCFFGLFVVNDLEKGKKLTKSIYNVISSAILLVRMEFVLLATTLSTASALYEMDEDYDKNIRPSEYR